MRSCFSKMIGVTNLFSENQIIFYVLLCVFAGKSYGCCDCALEFLTEELIPALCPIFETSLGSSSIILETLLSSSSNHHNDEDEFIPKHLVKECLKCGRDLCKSSSQRGNQLVRGGASLAGCSPALNLFFSSSLPSEIKITAEASQEVLAATKVLQMKMCSRSNVTLNAFLSCLDNHVIQAHYGTSCSPVNIKCQPNEKYRSYDGSCNNLDHPSWGRKGGGFTRIAKPRYADGIYSMPVAKSGNPLPSARLLSTHLFPDLHIKSRSLNVLNMQWGQFITHDMMLHMMEVTDEGGIQCCIGEGTDILPPDLQNDKCIPIRVPEDDPFYNHYGIKCLNFVRSITTTRDDCSLGYADQMNAVSSFLDGSAVYGSDAKTAMNLRSMVGGKLREEIRPNSKKGFLPTVPNKAAACDLRNKTNPCYLAGDGRINQTPTLAMVHTLLLREHNRIAQAMSEMNPWWGDERLYQETRKIVIAVIQQITYQEWLPFNFGENYFRYYRISPTSLYSCDYNKDLNPGIINSFGAAAFRLLHSLIPETLMMCSEKERVAYLHKLSDNFLCPMLMESSPDSFDELLRGSMVHASSESDAYCTDQITNLFFKSRNSWGMDLISMDIQRGRDHGIASYNEYREICGLRRARTFQDLCDEISQDRIRLLSQMYECVDDIDLFVGGAMERTVPGSIVGHTMLCIVAEQFYRTRVSDRFFYDACGMPHSFTEAQLREIKKTTMSRLVCDNSGVTAVWPHAFEAARGPPVSCRALPALDLTPWKAPSILD